MVTKNKINKKNIIYMVSGLVIGLILFTFILILTAPSLMMNEYKSQYDFNQTVEVFEQRVSDAGWGILNTHDMQAVKANLGYEVLPVKIFDLCSGQYSYEILREDDERIVTPMMPCRISIYEKSDGQTYIAMMNSGLVAKLFGGTINDVMQKATKEIKQIVIPITA
ncbi:MAG: DUF302 domain-containing protein [Candidatus Woesearchaeota archaeon]